VRAQDLIQRLREEQERIAHDALSAPASRDAFAYGRACGMYAGIGVSMAALEEMIGDQERAQRDL
jgi:hypothetical protein